MIFVVVVVVVVVVLVLALDVLVVLVEWVLGSLVPVVVGGWMEAAARL